MVHFETVMEELGEQIDDKQQNAAERLCDEGWVDIIDAREGLLKAGVEEGAYRYKVVLTWSKRSYSFQCTCGMDSSYVCPHVWATIVTAHEDGYYDGDVELPVSRMSLQRASSTADKQIPVKVPPPPPRWKETLKQLSGAGSSGHDRSAWPIGREVVYLIDRDETMLGKGLVLEVCIREPKAARIEREQVVVLPDGMDRTILSMLTGGGVYDRYGYGSYYHSEVQTRYSLAAPLARAALPAMCRTGRCFLRLGRSENDEQRPLVWGSDVPWSLNLEVTRDPKRGYTLEAMLEREGEHRPLSQPAMLTAGGLVFWEDVVEELDDRGVFDWVVYLRKNKSLQIPKADGAEFSRELYSSGSLPALKLPDELRMEEIRPTPKFHLKITAPKSNSYETRLLGEVKFGYEGEMLDSMSPGRAIVRSDQNRVVFRDKEAEAQAQARLYQLGWRMSWHHNSRREEWTLTPSKLAKVVGALVKDGWHVEAEGKLYRQPGELRIEVNSGIDWFELHGEVQFGDQVAKLPQLLAALRKGEHLVQLGDGTAGMLPEEWLKKYGVLARMGKEQDDHLRFARSQVGLLDALLAAQPEATFDGVFEKTRQMLRSFDGIVPADAPSSFTGELRPYQKDGLGWLKFLREFSFGGCLADDMGLGKTVQVLAMLLARKEEIKSNRRPSLVVVPRSLVFNWMAEAKRFAPGLTVLDHSHAQRTKAGEHLSDYDVVLTTYGTLRNDAVYLKDIEFDYLILDESQAIKNAASESAKAARLLQGRHRLALSGTPVQNHLGDLWSLFEFLNPGMLGTSSVLSGATALTKGLDHETKMVLAKALRPFILRRTKEQVAKDLPAKLEQTIYCELDSVQRKAYNELKEYYRKNLLDLIAREGMNKAKIQILEALLRLRQAACHPGLIDKSKVIDSSAKLDMLIPRLTEIAEEGHKALVFSQFTSFLAIVKNRLDKEKIKYEYLDGKTKDRQQRVDRFQTDPKLKLFLISLKAGGVGLNLTAADYVFLLDPWWNPAVEAQAIDRTHRIGQTRQVFACRLIAKDTVEEKVLELQKGKRELAEAIINGDNSVISSLGRAELELLLS